MQILNWFGSFLTGSVSQCAGLLLVPSALPCLNTPCSLQPLIQGDLIVWKDFYSIDTLQVSVHIIPFPKSPSQISRHTQKYFPPPQHIAFINVVHWDNLLYDALCGRLKVFLSSALYHNLEHKDFYLLTIGSSMTSFQDFLIQGLIKSFAYRIFKTFATA